MKTFILSGLNPSTDQVCLICVVQAESLENAAERLAGRVTGVVEGDVPGYAWAQAGQFRATEKTTQTIFGTHPRLSEQAEWLERHLLMLSEAPLVAG